jgi:hypothetical protein
MNSLAILSKFIKYSNSKQVTNEICCVHPGVMSMCMFLHISASFEVIPCKVEIHTQAQELEDMQSAGE